MMPFRTLCLLALLVLAASGAQRKPARLQGYDALALPGRTFTLRAKLEGFGLFGTHPDLHGEAVVFRLGETTLGTARTVRDGIAELRWTPPKPKPGRYEIRLSLPKESRYATPPARLFAFVRDPKRPVLVVDLDHTICAAGWTTVLSEKDPKRVPVIAGSVEALKALARKYDLLYLSARDDALIARSRDWLETKGFPRGPLLVRDLGLFTLSAERYKRKRLLALKRDFRLVAGVGDREDDGDAYLAAGMRALLIGKGRTPKGAHRYPGWPEIRKALEK